MSTSPFEVLFENISQLGKYTTKWELKLRLLLEGLGLEVYEIQEKENKEILYAKKISKIIKQLKLNYPYLDVNFEKPLKLRDAIAHSNFQELGEIIHDNEDELLYTKGFAFNINDFDNKIDLSKDFRKGDLKKISTFGLLLRTANNKITEKSIQQLNKSINTIDSLQELRAKSFERNYFDEAFQKGIKFKNSDADKYFDQFEITQPDMEKQKAFLLSFNKLIKDSK